MESELVYDYVDPINPSLECAICRNAFVDPAMSPICQHIFCRACVDRAVELSPTCPIDRSPLHVTDVVAAPRIVQQLVEELRVTCPNAPRCQVICERGVLESHLTSHCIATTMRDVKGKRPEDSSSASGAAGNMGSTDRDDDGDKENMSIPRRPCRLCQEIVTLSEYESHTLACSSTQIACRYCDFVTQRKQMATHALQCPDVPIPCPHARHGCTARLARSLMLEEHLEVTCAYEPVKEYLDRQETRLVEVESENKVLSSRCLGLERGMQDMRSVLDDVRASMGAFFIDGSGSTIHSNSHLAALNEVRGVENTTSSIAHSSPAITAGSPLVANTLPQLSPPSHSAPLTSASPLNSTSPLVDDQDPFLFLPLAEIDRERPSVQGSRRANSDDRTTSAVSAGNNGGDGNDTASTTTHHQNQPFATPLSTAISDLQSSVNSLSTALTTLEARQQTNLMNETLRIQDDVQSVRAVIHGLRLQMHYLLMEVGRVSASAGMGHGLGLGSRGGGGPDGRRAEGPGTDSASDDEELGRGGGTGLHHGGVGGGGGTGRFGMGMGVGMGVGNARFLSPQSIPVPMPMSMSMGPGGPGHPGMGLRGGAPLLYQMGGMKL